MNQASPKFTTPEGLFLRRGEDLGYRQAEDKIKALSQMMKTGQPYEVPAFLSTTKGFVGGAFKGQIEYRIKAHGIGGVDITDISLHSGEKEVLFNKGSKFRIDKIEKRVSDTIVYMTEVK